MPLKTTSLQEQLKQVGDYVSRGFSTSDSAAGGALIAPGFVMPRTQPKQAPEDLSEFINHSSAASGATIMVLDSDNNDNVLYITNKFFLQSFQMNFTEKVQLLETFGSSSVSFFGQTVKIYQFNGVAVDYPSTDSSYRTMHQSSLIDLYNSHMRGTVLLENNHVAVMKIMNHLVYGYPMQMNVNYSAGQDKIASFSLSWVVSEHSLTQPGWVSQRQLEQLYDVEAASVTEEQLGFLLNLNSIIGPINNLLTMQEQENNGLTKLRDSFGSVLLGGIAVGPSNVVVNLLNLQKYSFEILKENWSGFANALSQRAESVSSAIAAKRATSLGYESPKLSGWSDKRLDEFKSLASRATQEWEIFQDFKSHLVELNDLLRQLNQFKQRIT